LYPLAHLGISLTAARLGGYAGHLAQALTRPSENKSGLKEMSRRSAAWISKALDARFLLLGAVLPDIIDKPIGLLILKPSISAGHFFCHTALFALLLFVTAVICRGKTRKALFAVAIGVSFHLILDLSWNDPHTLFWPLLGVKFATGPAETVFDASRNAIRYFVNSPLYMWSELIGAILLAVTFGRLKKEGWRRFIKKGEL
jgi:inner membrane protein